MTAVLSMLEESFWIGGKEISISASIGVSLFPEHGSSSQQLLRNADSAMYCAKQNGKGRIEFWSRLQTNRQPTAEESAEPVTADSSS
jgi:diguanylate cyclase (GGDEF)-like protein